MVDDACVSASGNYDQTSFRVEHQRLIFRDGVFHRPPSAVRKRPLPLQLRSGTLRGTGPVSKRQDIVPSDRCAR